MAGSRHQPISFNNLVLKNPWVEIAKAAMNDEMTKDLWRKSEIGTRQVRINWKGTQQQQREVWARACRPSWPRHRGSPPTVAGKVRPIIPSRFVSIQLFFSYHFCFIFCLFSYMLTTSVSRSFKTYYKMIHQIFPSFKLIGVNGSIWLHFLNKFWD